MGTEVKFSSFLRFRGLPELQSSLRSILDWAGCSTLGLTPNMLLIAFLSGP